MNAEKLAKDAEDIKTKIDTCSSQNASNEKEINYNTKVSQLTAMQEQVALERIRNKILLKKRTDEERIS